jgi:hemin uptake protein HemP
MPPQAPIVAQGAAPMAAPAVPVAPPTAAQSARIDSQRLFGGASELQIDHHGVIYRLKQTALGKLILTK